MTTHELAAALRRTAAAITAQLDQLARDLDAFKHEPTAPAAPTNQPTEPAAKTPRPPRRRSGRRRAEVPPKDCEVCGEPLERRTNEDGHVAEHIADYRKRRTCSKRCSALLRQRTLTTPAAKSSAPAKRRRRDWTPDEIAILEATYPNGGAQAARDALLQAGHPERNPHAITVKARRIGLNARPTDDQPDDERVLALLRDYRGLPLTVDDIHDELGLKRTHARHVLDRLTEAGHITSEPDPSFDSRGQAPTIYRAKDHHAAS